MKSRGGSVSKYLTSKGARCWRFHFDGKPVDGKRRQITGSGFATRGDAKASLEDAIKKYDAPEPVPEPESAVPEPVLPRETLADWVREWLKKYAPDNCSPLTLQRYHSLAGYVLDATDGDLAKLAATPLTEVDDELAEDALRSLLTLPAKRHKHLSIKTVREVAAVLRVSLNKAFKKKKIIVNPLLLVELPSVERSEARALIPEDVQRLRDACRNDWTFTFVELSLATGTRRGELLALTWSDIDWLSSTMTISKSIEETRAGLRVKPPKSGKTRRFKIGPTAVSALRFRREVQQHERRLCGSNYKELGLIFCNPDGSYLLPHLVSQTISRRLKKAGISGTSLHSLRHTHASLLLSNGVPLTTVSARLGHADVSITARIYSHAMPADDARAADAYEKAINEPRQAPTDPSKLSIREEPEILLDLKLQ